MPKIVDLLVRKDGYTHEEFVERWQGEHADLAKELPGLERYVTSVPTRPEESEYDGVLELYFEDMAALGDAFDSEIAQTVQDDAAEFIDPGAGPRLIVEETVQLDERHD
ncbi:EthD domain-containing protein [Natronoarchaeum mannanilyticum]|uniref:EthD domain-containing protein n=1 Tax=Natronoarchaeum mannanilyticum TaxID=926360 RepID=A0AAV3TE54_9EURY